MLTGQSLLSFVKANTDLDKNELARETGYVKITDKGTERLLLTKFHEALVEAQGLKLKSNKKPGKAARYVTTVHRTGVVLIGKTYVEAFGLEPGDELQIDVGKDAIQLMPKAAAEA